MKVDYHSLTGAYVLNSLPPLEHDRFEAHLKNCPTCKEEVAELQQTIGRVGSASAATPPKHLRERVLDAVAQTRQQPPQVTPRLRHRNLIPAITGIAAAASLIIAAMLGIQLSQTTAQLMEERQAREVLAQRYHDFAELVTADDARLVTSTMVSGGRVTAVVAHSHNAALFVTHELPPLPEELDYQLWVIGPDGTHSPGVVEAEGAILAQGVDRNSQLAVTIEPAGGSPEGTTDPVVVLPVD
ncbi:anti-sigma factor [Hoyosella sp. YIM 151337]|uniref:anti-sigma factor n=1 Tax=Hoyosella sp. YIM 151337 TaxID=2992742 RepID=UPI002236642A|nr:anti-sigma factor [Hoyosella sp. YIM 151337]MCW4354100.1 anti-sigma factor [Hoyosella sp. YIM 151337]